MTQNLIHKITNFEKLAKQILSTQKTKISNLNPTYKILKTTDIENYFLKNIENLEITSTELKNKQTIIAKDLTKAILKIKQQNKSLKQFQEIEFTNQTTKIELMKIFIKYEQYKNKHKFIDNEDIYEILTTHLTKNQKNLEEIKITIQNYKISENTYNNLNLNQKQLLNLLQIKTTKNPQPTKNSESTIIQTKNENSQKSFILEKLTNLKETNPPQTSYAIITNTTKNKIQIQNYLTNYGIKLDNFSTENLFKEEIIKYIKNILTVIQNPNSANNEAFYILDRQNVREETKRKITRKSSRLEKSIFKVLKKEKEFSNFQDENKIILDLKENLEILNKNKNSGINLIDLILQTIKLFKLYEQLIATNQKTQILCLNEFLKITKHFTETYKTNSLTKFLEYINNLNENQYKFTTSTNELTNIQILTSKEYNLENSSPDYIFFTNLNHTKYPLLQIKNLYNNETIETRDQDYKIQEQKFNKIISNTKIKNYLIYCEKNKNNIPQKQSKILEKLCLETKIKTKTYSKEIEDFKLTKQDQIKLNSIKKISELILQNKFDLAKSELEILKLTFGKKDLTSYFSTHIPHEIGTDKFKDIDTSKLVYSVSQLQTYESCPKKYMYNYIYKIPSKPRHYFDFGTSVHEALEFLSGDFDKKLSKPKLYTLGVKYLTNGWISKGYESAKQEKEYYKKGLNIIKEFIEKETKLRKQNRQTIGLEKKFFIDFDGRKLMGYIDRIDKVDGQIEILDYKTSNSMSNSKDLEKNMQLLVYSLASEAHQDIKKFPKTVGLWYVLHDKIITINPKKEHTIEIKKRVLEQIKKIENKNFTATPTNFGCTYCDFNKICPDSISKQ